VRRAFFASIPEGHYDSVIVTALGRAVHGKFLELDTKQVKDLFEGKLWGPWYDCMRCRGVGMDVRMHLYTRVFCMYAYMRMNNVCLCIYLCVCVDAYVHTYPRAYSQTHMLTSICANINAHIHHHTYVRTYIHTIHTIHTHIHTSKHANIHMYRYIHTYTHKYIHQNMRTYICTDTYIHTYIHVHRYCAKYGAPKLRDGGAIVFVSGAHARLAYMHAVHIHVHTYIVHTYHVCAHSDICMSIHLMCVYMCVYISIHTHATNDTRCTALVLKANRSMQCHMPATGALILACARIRTTERIYVCMCLCTFLCVFTSSLAHT
jgi:hypothetical protein